MTERNLFFIAAKTAMRFPSARGLLTVEDLFAMPLTSVNGFSLNDTAKSISGSLKALGEESFVDNGKDAAQKQLLTDALDIVKAVIAHKQEENAAALARKNKKERRAKLLEAIENRDNADLASKSKEDLLKELEELDD